MKTAQDYIESVYGTGNFARTVDLKDAQSIIDLIQDYGDYLIKETKKSYSEKQAISDNWISVSERLPEDSCYLNQVLIFTNREFGTFNRVIRGWLSYYNGTPIWYSTEANEDEVLQPTHWIPLPKPPSEIVKSIK